MKAKTKQNNNPSNLNEKILTLTDLNRKLGKMEHHLSLNCIISHWFMQMLRATIIGIIFRLKLSSITRNSEFTVNKGSRTI